MASVTTTTERLATLQSIPSALHSLENGDHLSQKEFHARYELMPEGVKAELIGGVVYMQAALKRTHGRFLSLLMLWLRSYEFETPGVESYDNTTTIMGEGSEPQPDGCLFVSPERGGQMRFTEDDYLQGAPEFIGEIASSSESIDLHGKRRDYQRAGVREYLVVALRQQRIFWFAQQGGGFEEASRNTDGYFQSLAFPGLWLDPVAFLALDDKRLIHALELGLASKEHADFVKKLHEYSA